MELNQILERLDYTIEKAKELKIKQFKYSSVVTDFDFIHNCGTVCCIFGHYPNWGIEGFYYDIDQWENVTVSGPNGDWHTDLMAYHGLTWKTIHFLFFGSVISSPTQDIRLSLKNVIQRFKHVRKLLASGEMLTNAKV